MKFSNFVRMHWAAFRALLVLTVLTGLAYPLFIWLLAQIPGLHDKAEGSMLSVNGKPVGQLGLVTVAGAVAPLGTGTTYRPAAGARVTPGGQVTPGALVLSNVNAASGLSGLAELVGWYQANEESAHTIAQVFNTFLSTGVNP